MTFGLLPTLEFSWLTFALFPFVVYVDCSITHPASAVCLVQLYQTALQALVTTTDSEPVPATKFRVKVDDGTAPATQAVFDTVGFEYREHLLRTSDPIKTDKTRHASAGV